MTKIIRRTAREHIAHAWELVEAGTASPFLVCSLARDRMRRINETLRSLSPNCESDAGFASHLKIERSELLAEISTARARIAANT